jgi:hypothetical protein
MPDGENNQTPPDADTWYKGVDAETVGLWENKGWDKTKPETVALAATKAYGEVQKMIGMKADHDFIPVPKDMTKGDMNPVWEKLGRPKAATEYDFKDVKFKDGTELDEDFTTFLRERAFKSNLPKDAAADMARGLVEYLGNQDAKAESEKAAGIMEQKAALAKNWGTTPDKMDNSPQMLVAKLAAQRLGVDPETVNALESAVGYAKVMEMFRSIGTKIGEDKFITGAGPGSNNGAMSREGAVARKAELYKDPAWVSKFLAGSNEHVREMANLDRLITG